MEIYSLANHPHQQILAGFHSSSLTLEEPLYHSAMIVDSRSREASSSSEKKEQQPPPYSDSPKDKPLLAPPRRDLSRSSSSSALAGPPPPQRGPVPAPTVNQVHLQTGPKPLSGTFYIDPRIPSLGGFDAKGHKGRKKNPPHASFRTRGGAISLDLGTTGDVHDASKASVLVSSRTGNIMIKLLPAPITRPRIGLEVFSRRGDIILFIPKTFCGAIQLSTRQGNIQFLPALAALMRIIKNDDEEALVLVGDQTLSRTSRENTQALDFCQLNSRGGKLIVGISGQDRYEPKVGFWKKLGSIFGDTH